MMIQGLSPRFTWLAVALWMGLTVLGYMPGGDLHYQVDAPVMPFDFRDIYLSGAFGGFIFGAVPGLIIGGLQWAVFKLAKVRTRSWIPMNMLAFGLVHALNDSLPYLPLPMLPFLLVGGLIVGLGQSLALRDLITRPVLWIPLAAVTWVVAFSLGNEIILLFYGNPLAGVVFGNGLKGLVTGLITGFALKFMLRARPSPAGSLVGQAEFRVDAPEQ